MKTIATRLFPFFILAYSICTYASEESQDIYTRFSNYNIEYKINTDGSFVEKRSWAMQILKEQALEYAKQFTFSYSTSIQKADVIEAYTLKANGKRIDVPKNNFQVSANGGTNKNLAIFSDTTTLSLVFPEVEVGDQVIVSYTLTATEPIFPNHFSETESFYKTQAYNSLNIKVDAPKSLKLNVDVRELTIEKNTIENDRRILVWSWQNKKPIINRRQDYSVYNYDEDAGFSISTFSSHEEIAKAYGSRATPKAKPTERIKKLADEITKNKSSEDDIAHSLYDWVATNITYAGNCVGLGAVIPHDLDFILDNRMGDCKDHATLLQALLTAKNIASTQALVNASSSYKLPKIPVVSMVNHVINYIPSMNLFLDSTAAYIPYRMLPFSVEDKPVLLVENFQPNMKVPVSPVNNNEQMYTSYLKVGADGSAQGKSDVKLKGIYAANARARIRQYSIDNEKEIVKNNFKHFGATATGEFTKEDPKSLLSTYNYSASYEVKDLFRLSKTGAISILPVFYNEAPISNFLNESFPEDMSYDVACSAGKSSEELVYEFPKEVSIISIPDNFEISNKFLTYNASYKQDGNTISVKRVFDDKTKGNICSPDIMNDNKKLIKKAIENYKEQVIYKKL